MHILGIVGSLRKQSLNRALMHAFLNEKPEGVTMEIGDIGTLSLFNDDMVLNYPKEAQTLKDQIASADIVIIATPEYNRSVPGVLKNAIDWVSRPHGENSFDGKKVLVVGASSGALGTVVAQYDLKRILLHGNADVFGRPEFFLSMAKTKFDEAGNLIDETTREHIKSAWNIITT